MITCHYCGEPATTRDHIVPMARRGLDVPWNRVPACRTCNGAKADAMPSTEHLAACQICRNAVARWTAGERGRTRAERRGVASVPADDVPPADGVPPELRPLSSAMRNFLMRRAARKTANGGRLPEGYPPDWSQKES